MAALYGRWKRSSPPSASGSVGGLPSEGLQARTGPVGGSGGGEGLLAVKSAKPCSPPPSLLRSDSHAAWLQTRCPFSEHAVHVAGGRRGSEVQREYRHLKLPLS